MLAIISHSKNFESQTAFQMIFENGTKAIATCSRGLQLAQLKLSIKYQCCGGSLQSSHQKNIRFDCNYSLLRLQSQTARLLSIIAGFLADVFDCYTWSFIMSGILVQIAALLPLVLFCLRKKKGFDLKNNIISDKQLATYRHYSIWST